MSGMALPADTSPLGGLENVYVHHYMGIKDLQEHVRSQSAKLQAGCTNQQYLVFRGVTKGHLARIDSRRDNIGKDTRMSHYVDCNLLIIKLMPSVKHEMAFGNLSRRLDRKLWGMGLPDDCLLFVGAGRFSGRGSSKEADGAFKPASREKETDWPTIVFESGLSESLARLRHDAVWWLDKSAGDVKIVIIISITPARKRLIVEKWCLSPPSANRPATRALPANSLIPTKMQQIIITQNQTTPQTRPTVRPFVIAQPGTSAPYGVAGAPLILEFQNILLRAPAPPEGDVVFSADDLSRWADGFWKGVK